MADAQRRKRSIHTQVMLVALVPALAVALVLGAYFIHTRIQDLEASLEQRGEAIATYLAPIAEYGVLSGDDDMLQRLAVATLKETDVVRVTISDNDNQVLAHATRVLNTGDDSLWANAENLSFHVPILPLELAVTEMEGQITNTTPYDPEIPIGWVTVELSREATLRRQQEILVNSFIITLLMLAASALLAAYISRAVYHPILRLTETVEQLGGGQLDARVPVVSTGELRLLEEGINHMAGALQAQRQELQEKVDAATAELRQTLEAVELQNAELDIARKRALQLSREKSEFLANMSHEIRTPMHGLLGFLDLLLRTPLNDEQRDYANTIRKSGVKLLEIVNEILDFSKIESGKLSIDSVPFNLRDALEDVVDLMAPEAHQKDLEMILMVYGDVPLNLYGDPGRIRQVMLNLIGNAIKFTDAGSITVRVMLEDPDTGQGDDVSIRVNVTDTGVGLSQEQQNKLFLAFSQVDGSATRQYGGTGLGLFISRRLVEQMGGKIGVESQQGEGSTFWFTLPLRRQKPDEETGVECPIDCSGFDVLVWDPHPLACLATRHALAEWGMQVWEADSLETLLNPGPAQPWAERAIDLVVLGLATGADDPEQVGERLQALGQRYSAPVILLVNTVDHSRLARYCELGAAHCLSKPVRYKALNSTVARTLGITAASAPEPPGPAAEETVLPPIEHDSGEIHVLLADDNDINRKLIARQVEAMGVQVTDAVNGTEAVKHATEQHFDLILMDVHMPDMSGEQATQKIRASGGPNWDTPIVALTADALWSKPQRFARAGMNGCLIKPVAQKQLWEAICQWTELGAGAPRAESNIPSSPEGEEGRDSVAGSLAAELMGMLTAEIPDSRRLLAEAFDSEDWEELKERAHKVHGSAAYCHAYDLETASAELERVAPSGNRTEIELALQATYRAMDALLATGEPEPPADSVAGLPE